MQPLSIEAPFAAALSRLIGRSTPARELQVLELGSGGTKHGQFLSDRFDIGGWQLSDTPRAVPVLQREYDKLCSQRRGSGEGTRLLPPIALSFQDSVAQWQEALLPLPAHQTQPCRLTQYDLVFTANTFHVAPWWCTVHMLSMLPTVLRGGGCVVVYGPFGGDPRATPQQRRYLAQFDRGLVKRFGRDAAVRPVREVEAAMSRSGLSMVEPQSLLPEGQHVLVGIMGR